MKLRSELFLFFGIPFLCLLSALSIFYYFYFVSNANETMRNYLQTASAVCIESIDLKKMDTLYDINKKDESLNSSYYKETLAKLYNLQNIYQLAYIYTLIPQNGGFTFIFDSGNFNDTENSFLTSYEQPPVELKESYETGQIVISRKSYTDEYGTFISIFVPIKNDKNVVTSILGMDYNINFIKQKEIQITIVFCISFCLSCILSLVIISVFSNKVIKPINILSKKFTTIAEGHGDLTRHIEINSNDEINHTADCFNEFNDNLRSMITDIQYIASDVAGAAEHISTNSVSISENLQNQSILEDKVFTLGNTLQSNVENIEINIDIQENAYMALLNRISELNKTILEMSTQTKSAFDVTKKISDKVKDGHQILQKSSNNMNEINESSKQMTSIMEMITDISDQINLLSLNAAIESARAGNAGRGFAVVADEIAKLADRTSTNITDIQSLIKSSEQKINEGISLNREVVVSINSILDDTNIIKNFIVSILDNMQLQIVQNNDLNRESNSIKAMSNDINEIIENHGLALKQIFGSLKDLNSIDQSNVQSSEELSSSAEEMANMAANLKQLSEKFKVS